ncbi:cellulose binding domain-containing protein [Actinomadura hibisca]|uniref:cellulose binding domain-containing protein n=1 Tax=Actinomadura hibisca TaxID=68565 RepID=UPI0008367AD8|nr:cellulose binding domain-containing protein [Actinomadura hibisca]
MGRHTKLGHGDDEGAADDAGPSADPSRDARRTVPDGLPVQAPRPEPAASGGSRMPLNVPLPLLPIVAAVAAVGVVAYAFSTQQISLNFGGGGTHAPQADGPHDSQVSQRNPGQRASRGAPRAGAPALTVAFQVTGRTATAFRGTAVITNRGAAAAPRWTLAFGFPATTVRALAGGTVVRTGKFGWVRSPDGAPGLAPGQSVKIVFSARGTAARPSFCKINGASCTPS